ncbi:penicillin-binding protein 1A [Litoribrevibacter albus]|nr:penicillin-binding protein 1A [Litoribrevibacter albus]
MIQATFKTFKITVYLIFSAICFVSLIFSGVTLCLIPNLPAVEEIQDIQLQVPLKIFTEDGKLIAEYGEKHRTPINYHEIPTNFVNALISAEDNRFWEHQGVDLIGLARAAFQLATTGSIKSGGSTITMQVAKNYFLSREKTFSRKFNEILLALQIERSLSKEQILELYLNKIYLGHRSYGIAAAARTYYGKPVQELTLAQTAMIAGLPKAPSAYNPIRNPERAIERRNWILDRMLALNYITSTQNVVAKQSPVTAKYHAPKSEIDALYAADIARAEALNMFPDDIYTGGYKIFTSINSTQQAAGLEAIATHLEDYSKRHGYLGPEDSVDITALLNTQDSKTDLQSLTALLKDYRQVNHLIPALVWEVTNDEANLISRNGDLISLPTKQLTWARKYISADKKGPRVRKASDVLASGDIVRVYKDQETDEWRLGQLPKAQAALVAINPKTGAINALQGGFEFYSSKFNRATSARRQAGSAFKPFIYYSALEDGFTAASIVNDAPVVFQDKQLETAWRPENAGGKFYGPTRLRQALYQSRNLISIRIVQTLGIKQTIDTVKKFGFSEQHLPKDLSIALGSAAVTPLELATAYSTIANGGTNITPYLIDHIEDFNGNIVYQNPNTQHATRTNDNSDPSNNKEADKTESSTPFGDHTPSAQSIEITSEKPEIDPRSIYIITDMMKDVIKLGTGRRAKELDRDDIAGKTGTTNDQVDAWFSGFNGDLVTTVWVGFDSPSTLGRNEYGGRAALPIWIDFMKKALPPYESNTKQPEGIVTIRINPTTGHRALPGEKDAIFEIFRSEHVPPPPEEDNARPVLIDQGHPTDVLDELF